MDQQMNFDERIIQVRRVSKKTKGGNKMGFSTVVVVGDNNGKVGMGHGKAPDVSKAIRKASAYAKKHMMEVVMRNSTIPHEVNVKVGAAKLILKPAPAGTGVIAGGPVRAVLEAAGVKDVVSKILGTNNQSSNVNAVFEALSQLRSSRIGEKGEKIKARLRKERGVKDSASQLADMYSESEQDER
jgi:small subunit ribosomal protein S5